MPTEAPVFTLGRAVEERAVADGFCFEVCGVEVVVESEKRDTGWVALW